MTTEFKPRKIYFILKKTLKVLLPIAFWISVWQILAAIVDHEYFLPDAIVTFKTLLGLFSTATFWRSAALTLSRVVIGLALGTLIGIVFAFLTNAYPLVNALFSPIISIIKATPVATFIVLLWIMMSGGALSILIAVLMVMPIVWQNLTDAFKSMDKELLEVAEVFQFSYIKKLKLIVFPTLLKYLAPALITATGLAWKSEIAAEIIAYTRNSIGQEINDAKYYLNTPLVFAWTIVIIAFSISLEKIMRHLLGRFKV